MNRFGARYFGNFEKSSRRKSVILIKCYSEVVTNCGRGFLAANFCSLTMTFLASRADIWRTKSYELWNDMPILICIQFTMHNIRMAFGRTDQIKIIHVKKQNEFSSILNRIRFWFYPKLACFCLTEKCDPDGTHNMNFVILVFASGNLGSQKQWTVFLSQGIWLSQIGACAIWNLLFFVHCAIVALNVWKLNFCHHLEKLWNFVNKLDTFGHFAPWKRPYRIRESRLHLISSKLARDFWANISHSEYWIQCAVGALTGSVLYIFLQGQKQRHQKYYWMNKMTHLFVLRFS